MIAISPLELLAAFPKVHVLVVGDVMLDRFVHGSVERISPEAPIPVLLIDRIADMMGGAANVARNVATLGAKATLVGVVGDDQPASDLRTQLALIPSLSATLLVDASRPTTVKTRHVADRQQVLRADRESRHPLSSALATALIAEVRRSIAASDVVILSDYAKGVLTDEVVRDVIAAARLAGKPVLVDPKSRTFERYRGATLLTPNRQELQLAWGQECGSDEQVAIAARATLAQGICDALVVTRGKDGMSVVTAGAATHIRTFAREVFDVSGAGDTAVAVLAIALGAGGQLNQCAALANAAAGIVVGKYGTAVVTAAELAATLEQSEAELSGHKNFTLESVLQLIRQWRALGVKVAFTNGCFDLLHPGHLALLTAARRTADRLVVGLNSDLSVRRLKGAGRPVQGEVARANVLASLKAVDAVVIFEEDTPLRLIERLEPDVLVKGADYKLEDVVGADVVARRGGSVVLVDLVPAQSTTGTIEKLAKSRPS